MFWQASIEFTWAYFKEIIFFHNRKKSWNGKSNSKGIKDHRSGTATNAETYTELGNTVSGESENQYDSISRQENNINTNVL